jgi:hypothetical protein
MGERTVDTNVLEGHTAFIFRAVVLKMEAYIPSKHWCLPTGLHGVTTQKNDIDRRENLRSRIKGRQKWMVACGRIGRWLGVWVVRLLKMWSEVLTAVSTKVAVFWVVAPCRLVWRYDDGGSTDLWNVGKLIPVYMALHPRKQSYSSIEN